VVGRGERRIMRQVGGRVRRSGRVEEDMSRWNERVERGERCGRNVRKSRLEVNDNFGVTLMEMNVCGYINKKVEVGTKIEAVKPDIVVLVETFLVKENLNSELKLDEFNVYRKDRDSERGGVLIAVAKKWRCSLKWIDEEHEQLAVEVKIGKVKLVVFGVYRHKDNGNMGAIRNIAEQVEGYGQDQYVIVAGDVNLPKVDWEDRREESSRGKQKVVARLLNTGLTQVIKEYTREHYNGTRNLLDVVLVRPVGIFEDSRVLEGVADHRMPVVKFKFRGKPPEMIKKEERVVWRYDKANIEGLGEELAGKIQEWKEKGGEDVNKLWDSYVDICTKVRESFVPNKNCVKSNEPFYYNKEIGRGKRRVRRMYNKYIRGKLSLLDFKREESKLNELKWEGRNAYMKNLFKVDDFKGSWRSFYKHLSRIKQGSKEIGSIIEGNGKVLESNSEKAEAFSKQYVSVFNDREIDYMELKVKVQDKDMDQFRIRRWKIIKIIKEMENGKACGEDNIVNEFLKLAPEENSWYLEHLFDLIMTKGVVPSGCKKAVVVPIFKGGNSQETKNYRPVSLVAIVCKILEKLVAEYINIKLGEVNFITEVQHGFRKKYSCDTQLTGFVQEIADALDEGKVVHAIFLDFEKAFDKVPHDILIKKVKGVIKDIRVVNFIIDFLKERVQSVRVGEALSEEARVTSGVPQGSVLGPLLFSIFIQDMAYVIKSSIRLFADDSVIYRIINTREDEVIMQSDLRTVGEWVEANEMKLNVGKCKTLKFSYRRVQDHSKYRLQGVELENCDYYKYLGINIDSKLQWGEHIKYITGKSRRNLEFIMRNLKGASKEVKSVAYLTMVRPMLEYGCMAWDPHLVKDIKELEKVQRRAARRVNGKWRIWHQDEVTEEYTYDSVTDMVRQLGWEQLSERRRMVRLGIMHKIDRGNVGWSEMGNRISKGTYVGRRDHSRKYEYRGNRKNVGGFSFVGRTVKEWNGLSQEVVDIDRVREFKRRVGQVEKTVSHRGRATITAV
jgi:hypothetical protein